MVRADEDETAWGRQLLVGVVALVVVALVIGAVVSVLAVGAARVAGIEEDGPTASREPSLYLPSDDPTTSPETFPEPEPADSEATGVGSEPAAQATRRPRRISLQVLSRTVSANERINLTGAYRGAEGATLQVQRFESSWVDFPVDVTVRGGVFDSYITSGRLGVNRLRVIDKATGRTSNAVRVTIR